MTAMDKKKLGLALAALVIVLAAAFGFFLSRDIKKQDKSDSTEMAEKQEERLREACASNATYDRLKEVVFEEAVRIRNSDPANLDKLATHSVVRMEKPVVKTRDENLNVTVCTGRFVLELPPGAEAGFGGQRRLMADIEYAAQAAADASGLVYQLNGAEPIIYRLAAFDLQRERSRLPGSPPETQLADSAAAQAQALPPPVADEPPPPPPPPPPPETRRDTAEAPAPRPAPRPAPPPEPRPERTAEPRREPVTARASSGARPSFNCRSARTRSERMVCSSEGLAARDRAMSSLFYSALADADPGTRAQLRRTRDRFLSYRERCGNEACIAEAYEGRMQEIRDIMRASE